MFLLLFVIVLVIALAGGFAISPWLFLILLLLGLLFLL